MICNLKRNSREVFGKVLKRIWKFWRFGKFKSFWSWKWISKVLKSILKEWKALNSFRSLENNFDDDRGIIGVHFRVSKRGNCCQIILNGSVWKNLGFVLEIQGINWIVFKNGFENVIKTLECYIKIFMRIINELITYTICCEFRLNKFNLRNFELN